MDNDKLDVRVGQRWRDLDKRSKGRTVVITRIDGGLAIYGRNGAGPRLSISRMRRPFWELVEDAANGETE